MAAGIVNSTSVPLLGSLQISRRPWIFWPGPAYLLSPNFPRTHRAPSQLGSCRFHHPVGEAEQFAGYTLRPLQFALLVHAGKHFLRLPVQYAKYHLVSSGL